MKRPAVSEACGIVANRSRKVKQMLPLVPLVIRLFEGPDEKSVWFSAGAFV